MSGDFSDFVLADLSRGSFVEYSAGVGPDPTESADVPWIPFRRYRYLLECEERNEETVDIRHDVLTDTRESRRIRVTLPTKGKSKLQSSPAITALTQLDGGFSSLLSWIWRRNGDRDSLISVSGRVLVARFYAADTALRGECIIGGSGSMLVSSGLPFTRLVRVAEDQIVSLGTVLFRRTSMRGLIAEEELVAFAGECFHAEDSK